MQPSATHDMTIVLQDEAAEFVVMTTICLQICFHSPPILFLFARQFSHIIGLRSLPSLYIHLSCVRNILGPRNHRGVVEQKYLELGPR